ncbi:JAB domain-containing protein [Pedobacter sp. PWIIR3]
MVQKQTLFAVSEVELIYKVKANLTERPKLTCSKDSYKVIISNWNLDRIELCEEFKIVLLNRATRVLGISTISQGGTAGTFVDPKLVFTTALKANASSIILVHNHPSGNLKPSEQDLRLTAKLVQAGKYLDLDVIDHLIVSPRGYYSLGDNWLM